MKKAFVVILSLVLAFTFTYPFLSKETENVVAEEIKNFTVEEQVSNSPTTELLTDIDSLKEVNEELAKKNTFEIGQDVVVSKDEPGVEIAVNEIGDLQIDVSNEDVLNDLKKSGVIYPLEDENILGYTVVIKEDQIDSYLDKEVATPIKARWGNGLYVKKGNTTYGNGEVIRMSSYKGKCTATMSITESRQIEVSGTAGLPIKAIAGELGITYKSSYTISDTYEVSVPAGKTYRITAKDYLKIYNFEVWNDPWIGTDKKESSGKYKRPVGIAFTYSVIK